MGTLFYSCWEIKVKTKILFQKQKQHFAFLTSEQLISQNSVNPQQWTSAVGWIWAMQWVTSTTLWTVTPALLLPLWQCNKARGRSELLLRDLYPFSSNMAQVIQTLWLCHHFLGSVVVFERVWAESRGESQYGALSGAIGGQNVKQELSKIKPP